jgi:hypothetical protein
MRLLGFLEFVIVFIGVAGMAAANTYFLPKGVHLGLFLVGAGIALGGMESIATRGMSFRLTTLGTDRYAGAPALIWGWTLLLVGGTLIASAYLIGEGLWAKTVAYEIRRPGGLLSLMGFIVAGIGALVVFNPRSRGIVWTLLVRVPKTVIGLAIVIAGLAAIGLGIWETVEPLSFARVTRHALAQIGLAPFDYYWRNMLLLLP